MDTSYHCVISLKLPNCFHSFCCELMPGENSVLLIEETPHRMSPQRQNGHRESNLIGRVTSSNPMRYSPTLLSLQTVTQN
ncbi:hypothetical protein CEXT_479211 [Caerostris extrusa]|uniref:Uncharacterized protein n=1 Tax=Caerostris extrusa TaxID=172846 RepID=A0AAV4QUH1_CAEEX|nr:hypothetical protein CEXT_479211 [Caerostris extrusa]